MAVAPGLTVYRVDLPPGRVGAVLSDTQAANWELGQVAEAVAASAGPFDVIHAHDWLVEFAALHLKHIWRAPLVATIHATERGRHGGEPTQNCRMPSIISRVS